MHTELPPAESLHVSPDDEGSTEVPILLLRSLTFAFLTPAFAALIYGVTSLVMGLSSESAMGASVVFMAILLAAPDRRDIDWYGVCFITGATGLFFIGSGLSYLFGGVACLFAVLTLFDADTGKENKRKLLLLGIYLLTAGLAIAVFLMPSWGALLLMVLYMFCYLAVRFTPFGLAARDSLMNDSE